MTLFGCIPDQPDFYLGQGGVMALLTTPDAGYSNNLGQGRVDHPLLGGGHAVQHYKKIRRAYSMQWSAMQVETADLIVSFLDGLVGPGPYYFIDPAWRNVFPSHISAAGKYTQSAAGWFVSGGGAALYGGATVDPPVPDAPLSGVITVTGTGASSNVYLNCSAINVLQSDAPPVIQGLPHTASVYMSTLTGTIDFQLWAIFNDVNGANVSAQQIGFGTANTDWNRFYGTVQAGNTPATAVTWGLAIVLKTAAAPDLYIAAAMAAYVDPNVDPTNPQILPPWVHGIGVPKMLITGDQNASPSKVYWRRDTGLSLVESGI